MDDEDYEIMRYYHLGYKDKMNDILRVDTLPILFATAYNLGVKHVVTPTTRYLDSKIICEEVRHKTNS